MKAVRSQSNWQFSGLQEAPRVSGGVFDRISLVGLQFVTQADLNLPFPAGGGPPPSAAHHSIHDHHIRQDVAEREQRRVQRPNQGGARAPRSRYATVYSSKLRSRCATQAISWGPSAEADTSYQYRLPPHSLVLESLANCGDTSLRIGCGQARPPDEVVQPGRPMTSECRSRSSTEGGSNRLNGRYCLSRGLRARATPRRGQHRADPGGRRCSSKGRRHR